MKTKNILLPAIALLAGTLLSAPACAQLSGDYHDDLESIRQDIKIEIPTQNANQKAYLDVPQLYNQMNEDLPIDYEKLFKAASNSIKDNKVSAQDQYELMVFAIQMNHNKVLETLLKAGFKANINVELAQAGTEVSPLAEIAQAFNNTEALKLIETYMPKMIKRITPKEIERLKNIEKRPHGEYMYKIDQKPAATAMKVVPNESLSNTLKEIKTVTSVVNNNTSTSMEARIALAITEAIISGKYPHSTKNPELDGLRNRFQNGELTREQLYTVVLKAVQLGSIKLP